MFGRPRITVATKTYRQRCDKMQSLGGSVSSHGRNDSGTDMTFFDAVSTHEKMNDSVIDSDSTDDDNKSTSTLNSMVDIAALLRESDDDEEEDDSSSPDAYQKSPSAPVSPQQHPVSPRMSRRNLAALSHTQRHQPWTPPCDLTALRQHLLDSDRLNNDTMKDERPYLTDICHLEQRLHMLQPSDKRHSMTLLRLEACREELAGARRSNKRRSA